MNALWLERMSRYRNSELRIPTAARIVNVKINRRAILLKRYQKPIYKVPTRTFGSINEVLLYEARAAKHFWRHYRELLPKWTGFRGREPRCDDVVNKLLDIGYHHLTNLVKKTILKKDISPSLGLIHVANKSESAPLAYDLVELFRADIVDAEALRYVRLKKRPVLDLSQKQIGHFLHEVNERLERSYYLRDFKQCHVYRYYLELQIIKFVKAVNRGELFEPLHLPARHESRCS